MADPPPATSRDYEGLGRSWRGDVVAGITVGVVALPLALAFGITTGLGATAGLMTAIVAGLVAGIFGGSNVQVSGPTGAMTVVLVPIVAQYGKDAVYLVGLMAGVLVVAASFGRLGRYLAYMPWPVIEGFTVGIAVIIFLQQVPAALGVTKPAGENTAAVAARAVAKSFGSGSLEALALVALVVVVMTVVPRLHRSLPASLLAVLVATVVARDRGVDHRAYRSAAELASDACAARDLAQPDERPRRRRVRDRRARGDREPALSQGRGRHVRHGTARPGP